MHGIIIQLSEEEFKNVVTEAVSTAMSLYQKNSSINLANNIIYRSRKEAAQKLKITLPTLNVYTKSGLLKGYRIGGRVLYRDDELDAALTSVKPLKYRR